MTRGAIVGLSMLGILSLGGAWTWSRSRGGANESRVSVARVQDADSSRLEAQLADLAEEVRQLRAAQREPSASAPIPSVTPQCPSAVSASERSVPVAEPADPNDGVAQAEAQHESIQQALDKEALDPKWSGAAQAAVLNAYSGADFENVKFVASCKTTLCRVDIDMSQSKQPDIAARKLAFHQPWPAKSFMRVDTNTNRAELYLARENHELPMPDESSTQ